MQPSGAEPCPPRPVRVILKPYTDAIMASTPYPIVPYGIAANTCAAKAASTCGFSRTPASTAAFAPRKVSSPGWNNNLTTPGSSSSYAFKIFAAPRRIVACRSCPHPCIQPFFDANSSPVSSSTGSASISLLRRKHLSPFPI